MNKALTNLLLSKFNCWSDRPNLKHFMPIEWNNKRWCCATDAHQLILIPENEDNKLEIPTEKTVDVAKIIPVFEKNIPIKISYLNELYDKVEVVKEEIMEECVCCEGFGMFYHYEHSYNCKSCNEKGKVESGMSQTVKDSKSVFKIDTAFIGIRYFENLLYVAKALNVEEIFLLYEKGSSVSYYGVGETIIGIAPKYIDKDNESEFKIIEIKI